MTKSILHYFQGTLHYNINLHLNFFFKLILILVENFSAPNLDFVLFMGPNLLLGHVMKKVRVASSKPKSKYRTVAHAFTDVIWIKGLGGEI